MLGNEKIDQVDSFTYLGSIISKDGGSSEDAKIRIERSKVFFTVENIWKNMIKILEATVIIVLKYGSEAWMLWKTKEDFLDVFQALTTDYFGYPTDWPYLK